MFDWWKDLSKGKDYSLTIGRKIAQFLYLVNSYRDPRPVAWVLNDKCKCLSDEQIYQKGKTIAFL